MTAFVSIGRHALTPNYHVRKCCSASNYGDLFKGIVIMKNPFMSMFLSGANKIAGSARAQATAAVKRETTKNAKQISKAWTDALIPGAAPARKKTTARR